MMATFNRKRSFRFRLSSLLVAITLLCILLAMLAQPIAEVQRERRTIAQLEELGATFSQRGSVVRDSPIAGFLVGYLSVEYYFENLYDVSFRGSSITDGDLTLLPELPYLFHLDLSGTKVTDAGLDVVSRCANLHELDVSNTQVTDVGIDKLKSLKSLVYLKSSGTAVTYPALTELDNRFPRTNCAEQRAIDEVQAFGGQAPSSQRFLEIEEFMGLSGRIGSELLDGLVILGMNRSLQLGHSDISHLAHLKSLRELSIHRITIEPGSFADVPMLPNLAHLKIYSTNIGDVDLQNLARQSQVREFTIHSCSQVTDAGMAELARLHNLKKLDVSACQNVTAKSMDYLRQQLPDCEIRFSRY